jgi:hypothetical protein
MSGNYAMPTNLQVHWPSLKVVIFTTASKRLQMPLDSTAISLCLGNKIYRMFV